MQFFYKSFLLKQTPPEHVSFLVFFENKMFTLILSPAGYPSFQTATYTSRSYAGITPGYTYQFPGKHNTLTAGHVILNHPLRENKALISKNTCLVLEKIVIELKRIF